MKIKISEKPVFIYGCDRSGTTMLGDIIGSIPGFFVTPESQFIHKLMFYDMVKHYPSVEDIYNFVLNDFRFKTWEISIKFDEFSSAFYKESYKGIVKYILKRYVETYVVNDVKKTEEIKFRWVDHTPSNMEYINVQLSWWKAPTYIHIVRDGRAVFSSIKYLDWGPNNALFGARFWLERELLALRMDAFLGNSVIRVRYEDLLTNYSTVLTKILNHLGVSDCSPEDIKGGSIKLPTFTKKYHSLVGKGLDKSRINAWKQNLSKNELKIFCSIEEVRLLLKFYGYEECESWQEISIFKYLFLYLHHLYRAFIHKFRKMLENRY